MYRVARRFAAAGRSPPSVARFASTASSGAPRSNRHAGMLAGALIGPLAAASMLYFDVRSPVVVEVVEVEEPTPTTGSSSSSSALVDESIEHVPKPSLGGHFEMFDERTEAVTNEDVLFGGKWTLLYFGFTKCAEVCPNSMKFLTRVMDAVEKNAGDSSRDEVQKLQTVFVTIDTVRDGPEELRSFLSRFRNDRRGLVGLYGDDTQTAEMARLWRVYFTSLSETPEEVEERKKRGYETLKEAIAADDSYQFDHSAAAYFIGPDGKLRDFFFREMGVDHAVDRIGLHLDDAYGLNANSGPS